MVVGMWEVMSEAPSSVERVIEGSGKDGLLDASGHFVGFLVKV